jgi:hypothetical protein
MNITEIENSEENRIEWKKIIFLIPLSLFISNSLSAQTINLECELSGSLIQYKGGKIQPEMSCDGVKEKCKDKYHISISQNTFSFSNIDVSRDQNVIDASQGDNNSFGKNSTSSRVGWNGSVFNAWTLRERYISAYDGQPSYQAQNEDSWEINRMSGAVIRKRSSRMQPVISDLFTLSSYMTGTCKSYTPKF